MSWKRYPKKEEVISDNGVSPELDRIRKLAQKAISLGEQVEEELAQHNKKGHFKREQ